MKKTSIKREYIPFMIASGLVCLNIPIVLIIYCIAPDNLEKFATVVVPIQCIILGICMIHIGMTEIHNNDKNYKKCKGIIKNSQFTRYDHEWLKTPIVSYEVNGEVYETMYNIGINGIISFGNFLKGKKVTVYYNEKEPQNGFINNYLPTIVGMVFVVVGLFIIFLFLF